MNYNKTPYQRKLAQPDWQMKRLELFKARGLKCEDCCSKGKELHIHHIYYLPNTKPQDYPDNAYKVLCHECHEREEHLLKQLESEIMMRLRRCGGDSFSIEHMLQGIERVNSIYKELNNVVYKIGEDAFTYASGTNEEREAIDSFLWELIQLRIKRYQESKNGTTH